MNLARVAEGSGRGTMYKAEGGAGGGKGNATYDLGSVHLLHPRELLGFFLEQGVDVLHDHSTVLRSRVSLLEVCDEAGERAFVALFRGAR